MAQNGQQPGQSAPAHVELSDPTAPLTAGEFRGTIRAFDAQLFAINRRLDKVLEAIRDISVKPPAKKASAKKAAASTPAESDAETDDEQGDSAPAAQNPPPAAPKKGRGKAAAAAATAPAATPAAAPADVASPPAAQNPPPAAPKKGRGKAAAAAAATVPAPAAATNDVATAPAEEGASNRAPTVRAVFIRRYLDEPEFKAQYTGPDVDGHVSTFAAEIATKKTETQKENFKAGKVFEFVKTTEPYKTRFNEFNEQYKLQNASKNAV